MAELPSGTVTFLFTDIEGSTARWEHQPEAMRPALARHDALLRGAIEEHGGQVVKTMGDAFHAAFARAPDAVAAAIDAQRRLRAEPWGEVGPLRVRMALHTGAAEERDGDYYGPALNRAARLLSAGHGGQVLLSEATAALARESLPPDAGLLDLGRHRLKDLTEPERVFQLVAPDLPAAFPPLASLDARPHNLPLQTTPLLAREAEVEAVRALLLRDDVRLVTLTGPGGTGKTRLALQVAAEMLDRFDDGAYFVEFAPISDPSLVISTVAQALGLHDAAGRPLLDVVADYLRARRLLLVLDNFEQVLDAATMVDALLRACAGISVLVTSRAALQLRGEREYPVPPLALPETGASVTPDALSQYGAVALFIERATAIQPDFMVTNANAPAVAEICARLDGLPLAIELAAARIRLFPPEAMLPRLGHGLALLTGGRRDLPARQRTLRDAIAWSYDLLPDAEQRLFRRLGVFVGGFAPEAAEAVCAGDGDLGLVVLDGVASLVEKSLLRPIEAAGPEARFGMLETIREYALERLEASGDAPNTRRCHAEHFLALAEEAEPRLDRADAESWLDRLQLEIDNFRAGLTWSLIDAGDTWLGLRLAGALAPFWFYRSHLSEGMVWLDLALARTDAADTPSRAKALLWAATLARGHGDVRRAMILFEEAVAMFRALGDRRGIALAGGELGITVEQLGDYERAAALLDESLSYAREDGDDDLVAMRLRALGSVACSQGDFARATALLEESLALRRRLGGTWRTAIVLGNLGLVALYQGDHERAGTHFEENLALFRQVSQPYGIAWSLHYLGRVEHLRGEDDRAMDLLTQSLRMRRELTDTAGIAQCLEGLAAVALAQAEPNRAARLFGAAAGVRDAIDAPLSPAERLGYDRDLANGRAQLAEQAFAAAWAEGQAMTLEQAVACALDDSSSA